jgi:hypothetical protein
MRVILTSTLAAMAVFAAGAAQAQDTIKIGLMTTQEGVFTVPGTDGIRGFQMALDQYNGEVAGKKIEWILGPTDATPDTAVRQARKLIEQDEVDFIIGPLSGSEGIAMRDYAKTIPNKTVINGISGALETTWVDPAPNFFRFNLDGSQWGYGLGSYVVNEKGWNRIATVAADYSFGYTNFLGFARLLRGRRRDRGAVLAAARQRRLRLHHCRDARRYRCHLSRHRRHRRGQLPQPVRAGRRRHQSDRRHHHGRPERSHRPRPGQGGAGRHADLRSAGRRLGR